ncbi:trichohyalin [Nematostella vectensis]|uniref:trichohyalin n=1 Tax=Nematostella vectensis TaxID=45351 RepID=UPI002076F667|nr:trichohyalin [Nematostella vectensis]
MSMSMPFPATSPPNSGVLSPSFSGFVMVSTHNDIDEKMVEKQFSIAKESPLSRIEALTKENEELKGILKQNNGLVQQYLQELSRMQQDQRQASDTIKREHSKAKEVVHKLKEKNQNLKKELEEANTLKKEMEKTMSGDNAALTVKAEALLAENRLLQSHISSLQKHITCFDEQFRNYENVEFSESWKSLLESMVSSSLSKVPPTQAADKTTSSLEDSRNLALKGDLEKIRDANKKLDEQLERLKEEGRTCEMGEVTFEVVALNEERDKLQKSAECLKEEKQELCKLLSESQENEVRLNQEKQLTDATIKKLEEMIAKLQKEKREEQTLVMDGKGFKQDIERMKNELETERKRTSQLVEERDEMARELDNAKKELQYHKQTTEECATADDDDYAMLKLKLKSTKDELFTYQKRRNEYEEKLNALLEKEKIVEMTTLQLEDEKEKIKNELEETKELMQAELESQAETYTEQTRKMHSELQEGRAREGSLRDQVCQLIQENELLEVKCNRLELENAERNQVMEDQVATLTDHSEIQLNNAKEEIGKVKSELANCKEKCKRAEQQFNLLKEEHDTTLTQHTQLMNEYEELMRSFQNVIDNNTRRDKSASSERNSYKAQLEQKTAQLFAAEEAIQKRESQLRYLDETLTKAQEQADRVPMLEQQVKAYQEDFNAEREAREAKNTELLSLRERVDHLQFENQELRAELDNVNQEQMAEMQRRHGSHVPVTTATGYPPQYVTGNPQSWYPGAEAQGGFFRRGGEPAPPDQGPGAPRAEVHPPEGPDEPWMCPGCRLIVESFDQLQIHCARCGPANGEGAAQPGPDHSQHGCCPKCGDHFPDLDTLGIHVNECLDRD